MRKYENILESRLDLSEGISDSVNHEAIVKDVYDNIDWSGGSGEQCLSQYARDNDIEIDTDEWDDMFSTHEKVDYSNPEFREWFAEWVEENYSGPEWEINNCFKGGRITLWRCITAPEDWTPEGRHPGIYWSYIESAAEAHWGGYGKGSVGWVMQTTVPDSAIDWHMTLVMAGQPDYEDEKEVRLKQDYPITIDKYWRK
jgi:hypothetical protein